MYLAHRDGWNYSHSQSRQKQITKVEKQVVVLGHRKDFHTIYLLDCLKGRGVKTILMDMAKSTLPWKLAWRTDEQVCSFCCEEDGFIPFSQINSVFCRTFENFEQSISLNAFMLDVPIRWCNSLVSWQMYRVLVKQLSLARQLGVNIPQTIMSDSAKHIVDFCQSIPIVLMKSAQCHLFSEVLQEELIEFKRIDCALDSSPISLQEHIPGTHIRSYVIGDKVFSAEMCAECLNPNEDPNIRILPLRLPEPLENLCRNLCRGLGMQWTAIDWRKDGHGHFYFLGADPSPEFFQFEQKTEYPITAQIMELLLS